MQPCGPMWVLSDYNRTSSETQMLDQLSWPTLQTRDVTTITSQNSMSRHDWHVTIDSPILYQSVERQIRHYHPLHFILPTSSTTSWPYQQPFYSRSIKEWNELPVFIIEMTNYVWWISTNVTNKKVVMHYNGFTISLFYAQKINNYKVHWLCTVP